MLGKVEFTEDPIEFYDPNSRNLLAEVSTEVSIDKSYRLCNAFSCIKIKSSYQNKV